jgi:hypothetical protein
LVGFFTHLFNAEQRPGSIPTFSRKQADKTLQRSVFERILGVLFGVHGVQLPQIHNTDLCKDLSACFLLKVGILPGLCSALKRWVKNPTNSDLVIFGGFYHDVVLKAVSLLNDTLDLQKPFYAKKPSALFD